MSALGNAKSICVGFKRKTAELELEFVADGLADDQGVLSDQSEHLADEKGLWGFNAQDIPQSCDLFGLSAMPSAISRDQLQTISRPYNDRLTIRPVFGF